jgi:glycosyltransferase involved in cell wall biosynthesis
MASGVPVVATNVAATNELVVNGVNGLLVPLDDARAVAEATRQLWCDRSLKQRIIEGGLYTARHHSTELVVPILEEYYHRAKEGMF